MIHLYQGYCWHGLQPTVFHIIRWGVRIQRKSCFSVIWFICRAKEILESLHSELLHRCDSTCSMSVRLLSILGVWVSAEPFDGRCEAPSRHEECFICCDFIGKACRWMTSEHWDAQKQSKPNPHRCTSFIPTNNSIHSSLIMYEATFRL